MYAKWRIIFAAALLCFASATAPAAEPEEAALTYRLEPEAVEPGERVRVRVELRLDAVGLSDVDETTELPELRDDLLLEVPDLLVLDRDFRRERDTLVWIFEVSAHKTGKYRVPPMEIRFGALNYSTETLRFEVVSKRPPNDEEMRDDFGFVSGGFPWKWILGLLAVASLGYGGYRLGRRHRRWFAARWRRGRRLVLTWLSAESPERWLRRELARLKALPSDTAGDAAALDGASRALREYLERRRRVPARAWTTQELLAREATAKRMVALGSALERSDEFRFGPAKVDAAGTRATLLASVQRALLRRRFL